LNKIFCISLNVSNWQIQLSEAFEEDECGQLLSFLDYAVLMNMKVHN